jgi:hypothetical protein
MYVGLGDSCLFGFKKIVFFDKAFGNLSIPGKFFCPVDCLNNFIEKKIFNIVQNKIIMQRYQNIKFRKRKASSST